MSTMMYKRFSVVSLLVLVIIASVVFTYKTYYQLIDFPSDKKIIVIEPKNGLGNQFFYYAAGLSISKRIDAEIWIATKYNHKKYERSHRRFVLDQFSKEGRPLYEKIIDNKLFQRSILARKDVVKITEDNFFDINAKDGNVFYLVPEPNFYQSATFFKNVNSELSKIKFNESIENNKFYKDIRDSESVGVHIRRGDFASMNWTLPISYQKKAMQIMRQKLKNPLFFVFSDDVEYVTAEFSSQPDVVIVSKKDSSSFKDSLEDFSLMMSCKNFISSNSTFSWWSSYLIKNPNKIIIVPEQAIHTNNQKYYPSSWTKLNV